LVLRPTPRATKLRSRVAERVYLVMRHAESIQSGVPVIEIASALARWLFIHSRNGSNR
jgi:hypothetical protein